MAYNSDICLEICKRIDNIRDARAFMLTCSDNYRWISKSNIEICYDLLDFDEALKATTYYSETIHKLKRTLINISFTTEHGSSSIDIFDSSKFKIVLCYANFGECRAYYLRKCDSKVKYTISVDLRWANVCVEKTDDYMELSQCIRDRIVNKYNHRRIDQALTNTIKYQHYTEKFAFEILVTEKLVQQIPL